MDMASDPKKVFEEAHALPAEARAALAASLIDSLDTEVDEGAEAAWQAEIQKRIQEIDSGAVKPLAWSEARRLILGPKDDPIPTD